MEFGVGSVVEGKVTGITKFGAFVSLPEGKSGLVHISEIAYSYVNDVKDYLQEGQEVKVKVIGIDDSGRINLSIKKTQEPPPRPQGQGRPMGGGFGGGAPSGGPGRGGPGGGGSRGGGGRGMTFSGQRKAPEPANFEDRLKQFMTSADSKLSELKYSENKRGNRRGGHH